MRCTLRALRSLWRNQRGATAVEYGMILALIVIGLIAVVAQLGKTTSAMWNGVAQNVTETGPHG
ncbi:MAG: Flp family type IVb pilin [Sphingomonas paucimobilis]